MNFAPVKRLGCCTACDGEIYDVQQSFPRDHAFFPGHPRRVGAMKPEATQVEFLMSDSSTIAVAFCIECAQALTPADYPTVWRRIVERLILSMRAAGRIENDIVLESTVLRQRWLVGQLRKRREGVEPGVLVVDRR